MRAAQPAGFGGYQEGCRAHHGVAQAVVRGPARRQQQTFQRADGVRQLRQRDRIRAGDELYRGTAAGLHPRRGTGLLVSPSGNGQVQLATRIQVRLPKAAPANFTAGEAPAS